MNKCCKKCHNKNKYHTNGMITSIWGPALWFSVQCMCKGYPCQINNNNEEHQRRKKKFYLFFSYILQDLLPCKICRKHYTENYHELPLNEQYLSSRENLCRWICAFHNLVNSKLGKSYHSYTDFNAIFENFRASTPSKKKTCVINIV